jgi:uncharacterized membrane protein
MPSRVVDTDRGHRHVFERVKDRPSTSFLRFLAVLCPVVLAYGILYCQSLAVPYQDDYRAILAFASDYHQLPTLKAKVLYIATKQFNEYKLGFEHSIVAAEIEVTRHLNVGFLTVLGNLFLLPIGYLLWRTYPGEDGLDERLLHFLPISLLFFALTYWENLNWAMTGLQNTPVILFSLLSIYLLAAEKTFRTARAYAFLACLAAALAAFSSANGFLLAPVGLLILLPRRAYAKSLLWCSSFVVPLAAYLYNYEHPVESLYRGFYITRPLFFLAFFGCVVPFRWAAALLGLMTLIVFVLAIAFRYDRTNPTAFYFAVWMVATGALVAWVRGGAGFFVASRYSIYSNLFVIFCYAFLAQALPRRFSGFRRKGFYITSVVIAAAICFMADLGAYQKLGARRRMVLSGIEFYRACPEINSPMIDPLVERASPKEKAIEQTILTRAIQERIYALPPKQEIR